MEHGLPGVVLIGMRRAGKTTVGRALAAALGQELVDTDLVLEEIAGRPAGELLSGAGEDAFRDVEVEAVRRALLVSGRVVATGGGAPLRAENRRRLAAYGVVLYLRLGADELVRRAARDPKPGRRPLLAGDSATAEVAALLKERDLLYSALADHVVPADGGIGDVCARCLPFLGGPLV